MAAPSGWGDAIAVCQYRDGTQEVYNKGPLDLVAQAQGASSFVLLGGLSAAHGGSLAVPPEETVRAVAGAGPVEIYLQVDPAATLGRVVYDAASSYLKARGSTPGQRLVETASSCAQDVLQYWQTPPSNAIQGVLAAVDTGATCGPLAKQLDDLTGPAPQPGTWTDELADFGRTLRGTVFNRLLSAIQRFAVS